MLPPPHTIISLLSSKVAEQEEQTINYKQTNTNTNNNNINTPTSTEPPHIPKVTKSIDFTKLFHNPVADLIKTEELEEPKETKQKS
jgi:hypothetical protein